MGRATQLIGNGSGWKNYKLPNVLNKWRHIFDVIIESSGRLIEVLG